MFCIFIFTGCLQNDLSASIPQFEIPTPGTNKGVVYGKFVNQNEMPVEGVPYLAKNLSKEDPEIPPTISLSLQYSPRAIYQEKSGEFFFQDVDPADNYVIALVYGPGEMIVVRESDTNSPLSIEVLEGSFINLSTVLVVEP